MRRIIQVIHTFIVQADNLHQAQTLLANSITLDLQPGVDLAGRQIKSSDPFQLSGDDRIDETSEITVRRVGRPRKTTEEEGYPSK